MRTAVVLALAFCCMGASPSDFGSTRPVRSVARGARASTAWEDYLPVLLAGGAGAVLGLWGGYQRGLRDGSQEGFSHACRHLREATQVLLAGRNAAPPPRRPPSTGITSRPALTLS